MIIVSDADGAAQMLGAGRNVSAITAGRQEYEGEPGANGIPPESRDLRIHARAEALFDAHPDLREAHSRLQGWVREAERYHRLRLESAVRAAELLWGEPGDSTTLRDHRTHAIRQIRTLDRQHVRQIDALRERFRGSLDRQVTDAIGGIRAEIVKELRSSSSVVIGGGHVTVLLNRLLLFDLGAELATSRVVAWGAGAMVCTERVLLFDDRGPLGPRIPEFLCAGLGLARGVVVLPDARVRMKLSARARIAILGRRLTPAIALILDPGGRAIFRDGRLGGGQGLHRITAAGRISRVRRH